MAEQRREKKDAGEKKTRPARRSSCRQSIGRSTSMRSYARFAHSVTTERPFLERLTQFWSNHFAVSVDKVAVLGLAGAMEREAIRPRVTGHFTDLLLAVEKHPAMLLYLDNRRPSGRTRRPARLPASAATDARSASTKTWRARFSSCTRWEWTAAIPSPMSPRLRRRFPDGRLAARIYGRRLAKLGVDNGNAG